MKTLKTFLFALIFGTLMSCSAEKYNEYDITWDIQVEYTDGTFGTYLVSAKTIKGREPLLQLRSSGSAACVKVYPRYSGRTTTVVCGIRTFKILHTEKQRINKTYN